MVRGMISLNQMKKMFVFVIPVLIAIIGLLLEPQTKNDALPSQSTDVVVPANEQKPALPLPENTYPVARVVDGDTIAVLMNGKSVTLRLIGLDTPETVDPRKPVQCFGKAASDKAKELLTGKMVRLEFDASQGTFDKYGRTLAYVYLVDPSTPLGASGTLFNEYMISAGYAHEYTYNLPYKYQQEFKAAQMRAREEKRGLWADDTCAGDTKKPAAS